MRDFILGVGLFVLLAVTVTFPQAVAESVLLNGASATAAHKAGATLGNTLNKTSGRIAGQIQAVPNPKVGIPPSKRAPAQSVSPLHPPTTTTGKGASMITSIRGGNVTRSPSTATPSPHN